MVGFVARSHWKIRKVSSDHISSPVATFQPKLPVWLNRWASAKYISLRSSLAFDLPLIFKRRQQVIAGASERPCRGSLRRTQPVHEERDRQEQGQARQLLGIDRERIDW